MYSLPQNKLRSAICLQCFGAVASSLACKIFCIKIPYDVVNVSGWGNSSCYFKSFGLSFEDAKEKDDWRMKIKGNQPI